MGEAKRRAAAREQSPGATTSSTRGIIVTSPMSIDRTNKRITINGNIDSQDFRFWSLFFDRIIWPSNNIIGFENTDADYLESTGFLERPSFRSYSGDFTDIMIASFVETFARCEKNAPGQFSISSAIDKIFVENGVLQPDNGVEIALLNAIPVPNRDVPLPEILEFREKRKAELTRLRSEIDILAAKIRNSPDRNSELISSIREIDSSCRDTLSVLRELNWPLRLTDIKISLDGRPADIIRNGIIVGGAAIAQDLSITNATLAGILGSAASLPSLIKVTSGFDWKGFKKKPSAFRYVQHYHNELF